MWEQLLLQVLSNVVVPEVAQFIQLHYQNTGKWPTKEELEEKVKSLADTVIREGTDFLNRTV
jgi:uncharacterized protein YeaC (DUF1315 family)